MTFWFNVLCFGMCVLESTSSEILKLGETKIEIILCQVVGYHFFYFWTKYITVFHTMGLDWPDSITICVYEPLEWAIQNHAYIHHNRFRRFVTRNNLDKIKVQLHFLLIAKVTSRQVCGESQILSKARFKPRTTELRAKWFHLSTTHWQAVWPFRTVQMNGLKLLRLFYWRSPI